MILGPIEHIGNILFQTTVIITIASNTKTGPSQLFEAVRDSSRRPTANRRAPKQSDWFRRQWHLSVCTRELVSVSVISSLGGRYRGCSCRNSRRILRGLGWTWLERSPRILPRRRRCVFRRCVNLISSSPLLSSMLCCTMQLYDLFYKCKSHEQFVIQRNLSLM